MATNNNLLEWAVAFSIALSLWQRGEVAKPPSKDDKFNRDRYSETQRLSRQALLKVYELRSQLPGVLALSGLKPAEIATIVAEFDKQPPLDRKSPQREIVYWNKWLTTYIRPLVKFPSVIRSNGLDWIR